MIAAYYKLEILSDALKEANGIKVGSKIPRYDCTAYAGDYEGMEPFLNLKGMFKLSLILKLSSRFTLNSAIPL